MKHLIVINDDGLLDVEPVALMIKEFKHLYERTEDRDLALAELGAVYLYADMRSPYMIKDKEERWKYIAEDIYEGWEPDEGVFAACDKYKELSRTRSMDSLEIAWANQRKQEKMLADADFDERDKSGKLIWSPKQLQDIQKGTPQVIKALIDMQRLVESEIADDLMLRGGRVKGEFEDASDNPD